MKTIKLNVKMEWDAELVVDKIVGWESFSVDKVIIVHMVQGDFTFEYANQENMDLAIQLLHDAVWGKK